MSQPNTTTNNADLTTTGVALPNFSEFPKELREMVWKLVANIPRTVVPQRHSTLHHPDEERPFRPTAKVYHAGKQLSYIPSLLHINQEARGVGLKCYNRVLDGCFRNPVYFNFKVDSLYLHDLEAPSEMKHSFTSRKEPSRDPRPIESSFQNLILDVVILNDKSFFQYLFQFQKLKSLVITGSSSQIQKHFEKTASSNIDQSKYFEKYFNDKKNQYPLLKDERYPKADFPDFKITFKEPCEEATGMPTSDF